MYNPNLSWHTMPESIEYIKILQEQGVSTFDPVKFYHEAKSQVVKVVDMSKLSRKERKKMKKNKTSKKAQKIITSNIKRKEMVLRDEEERKIEYLLGKSENINDMSHMINQMSTNYGRVKTKTLLLEYSLENNLSLETHLLFFTLQKEKVPDELKDSVKKTLLSYKSKYKKYDLIEIQMNELSSYLDPLNPLNKHKKKLDVWQVEVFERIEKKENIIVVAPTSAGKTVCSTYCAIVGKKTLFVVPSDELARQVAGIFRNMNNIMIGIITNKEYYMDIDVNVIVGTPQRLEEFLTLHLYDDDICNFDYVIYDEIQMLNSEEGAAFENIIKLLECPFLALSATIEKPNELKEWFELVKKKKVHLIKYNKRFIIQQRYLWKDNKLKHLHPIACVDLDFIKTKDFLKSELSFTPRDTYHLYNTIKDKVDDTKSIKPHNILNKKKWDSIDLNDTIIVEKYIKEFLSNLSLTKPDIVQEILNNYKVDETVCQIDIIKLIKVLINKDMCPAIFFKMDAFKCRIIFKHIVNELERKQNEKYPFHYDDMKLRYDAFCNFNSEWKTERDKIKIPKDIEPETFIENLKKRISEKCLNTLKERYTQIINIRNTKIKKSDISDKRKRFYVNYYKKKLNEVLGQDKLIFVDKNMPHQEFTFNYMGIDSHIMRGIRRRLRKSLGYDVKYTHPVMIGIERGVVPYFKDMETPFQRVVQSLFSQKKIPIIISDESLGYGINMPIRTVIMLGESNSIEKIDTLKANQMTGRSGRRGIDREGNIIYVGVNWKKILKGKYTNLVGRNPINLTLPLPLYFKKLKNNDINRLFNKTLYQFTTNYNSEINKENIISLISSNELYRDEFNSELMWSCRYLDSNLIFLPYVLNFLIKKRNISHYTIFTVIACLFDKNKPYDNDLKEDIDFDTSTLYNSSELMTIYKEKRIVDVDKTQNILNRLKVIAFALATINTVISKSKFRKLSKFFRNTFNNVKGIIVKYQF